MTTFQLLPESQRAKMRKLLRERSAEWLARFYRHELLVARTVRGLQIEAQQEFDRTVVNPLLRSIAGTLGTFTPRGSDLIPDAFPEIASLRREITATVASGSDAVRRLTEQRMAEIARQEVVWTGESARKLDPSFGAGVFDASQETVVQQVLARPVLGEKVETVFAKMLAEPTSSAVRAWVNTGIQQSLSTDEIVRGLRGTKQQTGILADKPQYTVAALTRTAASHASAVARTESFKALGVTRYRFVATLDTKTSVQCAANDGKVFQMDKGPMPPLHPNCRSTIVPDLGSEPEGTRASTDGQVPADQTFAGWLEGRTKAEQNEVLGAAKAEAWRSGKLTLDQMLGADLQPLSLAELRDMDRL